MLGCKDDAVGFKLFQTKKVTCIPTGEMLLLSDFKMCSCSMF